MASDKVTLAAFENDWLTPSQAVRVLDSVFGDKESSFVSKLTLLERLRGAMVRAIATRSKRSNRTDGTPYFEIPPNDWHHVSANSIFWISGDYNFEDVENYSRLQVWHFAVKFEPNAVRAITPPATKQVAVEPSAQAAKETPEEREQVSLANLRVWYAVYQSIYPDTSEDHAWQSAQGMFHDKSVSRSQIRKVRGERPMGRPKKG
jgi:hypothetical protein